MKRVGGWVVGMAALASFGCSTANDGLRARFAKERRCPAAQVSVSDQGGAVHRASGCGESAEYICDAFLSAGNGANGCRERGLNPHEPNGQPPSRAIPSRPDLDSPR